MNGDTKNACPCIAVPGQAGGAGAAGKAATTSTQHDTTAAAGRQTKIADFLGHGQETAAPLRHLKEMCL